MLRLKEFIIGPEKMYCAEKHFWCWIFPIYSMCLIVFLTCFLPAFGSSRDVGNGGIVVVCKDSNQSIVSTRLLDFYEGSLIFGLPVSKDYEALTETEIVNQVLINISLKDPLKHDKYLSWFNTFQSDAAFLKNMVLNRTNDEANIALENGCALSQAALQRKPLFPEEKLIYISSDLWDLLSEIDKAGLILHEIVYREAIENGQTNSRNTRLFVAYLFSDLLQKDSQQSYFERVESLELVTQFAK